ncbi:S8 family serine peptidase [Candidatus Poribacteria bacterium]|nr:S8 family serine peptidase [Candidatus Poribacteria bacterium]
MYTGFIEMKFSPFIISLCVLVFIFNIVNYVYAFDDQNFKNNGLSKINFIPDRASVPGEILFKFKSEDSAGTSQVIDKLDSLKSKIPLQQIQSISKVFRKAKSGLDNIYRMKIDDSFPLEDAINIIAQNSDIQWIEPCYFSYISEIPDDPEFGIQWGLSKIKADQAWDITKGSSDIVIAIIDTGVDYDHTDLWGNIWHNSDEIPGNGIDDDGNGYIDDDIGWDFVSILGFQYPKPDPDEDISPPDPDPMDFHGHGTICSGIASAATNNSIGIAGMTWNCKIMTLRSGYKVKDSTGGSLADCDSAEAIVYAADNGAHVISMSWGGKGSYILETAVEYALQKGCVLVAAAGNEGRDDSPHYPANYPGVIAVAASNQNDARPGYSNYGEWVDIAAPGESIYTTAFHSSENNDTYTYARGTSMATPFVSGTAALILSQYPELTAETITQILVESGDKLDWWVIGPKKRLNTYNALNISQVSIVINSPQGSELIKGGDLYRILWEATGLWIDHIQLMYSTDGFENYQDIVINTENSGEYKWQPVPTIDSSSVKIKAIIKNADDQQLAEYITEEFTIDSSAPETTLEIEGTEGNEEWYTTDVLVTISAADNLSEIKTTNYRINDEDWQIYSEPILITGTKLTYYSEDNLGNIEAEKSIDINIDKLPPEISAVLEGVEGENGWYTSDLSFTLSALDDVSGVKEILYKIGDNSWEIYTESFIVSESSEIHYKGIDIAGNEATSLNLMANIDKTKPTTPTVYDEGNFTNTLDVLQFNWSTSNDPESGVVEYRYSLGITPEDIYGWTSAGIKMELTLEGLELQPGETYFVGIKAKNGAGLWSDPAFSDGIKANTAPEVSDIPDISFQEDNIDSEINLDDYVVDTSDQKNDINWSYAGNENISVEINSDNRKVIFSFPTNWNGEEEITFTASDPAGLTDSDSLKVTIEPINDPPLVTNLHIEPAPPGPDDDLQALYTFIDIEDDPDNSIIIWYRNDEHQSDYDGLKILPTSATLPGENWFFMVIPDDGIDTGEARTSPAVTIDGQMHDITLYPGWNLISIALDVLNNNIESLFSPIDGLYSSIWTYDAESELWLRYFPGHSDNNLLFIEAGKSYWINMKSSEAVNIKIIGRELESVTIFLWQRWNMLGYTSTKEKNIQGTIDELDFDFIYAYDGKQKSWLNYTEGAPEYLNSLKTFKPGEGYMINLRSINGSISDY